MRLFAAALILLLPAAAIAQTTHDHHAAPKVRVADTPSTKAYKAAATKMHKDMAIKYTGDADRDFIAGMIPHHHGAVAMAQIVLKYGKDPEVKKLAHEIIAAQEKEIGMMQAWQAKQPKLP